MQSNYLWSSWEWPRTDNSLIEQKSYEILKSFLACSYLSHFMHIYQYQSLHISFYLSIYLSVYIYIYMFVCIHKSIMFISIEPKISETSSNFLFILFSDVLTKCLLTGIPQGLVEKRVF